VTFPEPLDNALLYRMLSIRDSTGQQVEGAVEVSGAEAVWKFQPATTWEAGRDYTLRVDPLMEDLAGNTPVRVFDSEMQADTRAAPDNQNLPRTMRDLQIPRAEGGAWRTKIRRSTPMYRWSSRNLLSCPKKSPRFESCR